MNTTTVEMHYTPHQATMNAMACFVCGIKPITRANWIEADIEANVDKAEKCHQHDERMALKDQVNFDSKVGAA